MAFDGIVISNLVDELNSTILGGRLYKIAQPEADELLLTIKTQSGQYRLCLSANASLPLCYLTDDNKPSPITAPNYCMLLRKHLNNGRIISITQPGLERIIDIEVEHLNELGDLCQKHIICEFMGKHSNIILVDNDTILDSIKHVSAQMSSVREVLPARPYFIPQTTEKLNPLVTNKNEFFENVLSKPMPTKNALYSTYTGISPVISEEICFRAGIDSNHPANCLYSLEQDRLFNTFEEIMTSIKDNSFSPCISYENDIPKEFSAINLSIYDKNKAFDSISEVIRTYYSQKELYTRMRQRTYDIRKNITVILERSYKKLDIQEKQIKSTEKRDKYRIYGELITTYGYEIKPDDKELKCINYYNNEEITIPIDNTLSPIENANKYFARYNKLKRTYEASISLVEETKTEIEYLESIITSLDIATTEDDLNDIKDELISTGYIKSGNKKNKKKSSNKPLHYISSDGFDIYVGKNNNQNDELTFKFANGNDWWFHAKQMPGSHVIVKTEGKEIPDRTFEEAASLAAYYSKGRDQEKVEIDYVLKKEVKKPAGSKPGFVVYYTNYSLIAVSDISHLKQL